MTRASSGPPPSDDGSGDGPGSRDRFGDGAPRADVVRVLVVDDEPLTAEAHAAYVARVDGFALAGVAHDGRAALARLRDDPSIDLVLLDMNLPDTHGIALCRALRTAGSTVDVIAVTAVRDVQVVRAAVSLGIVQYLIKPFTYAAFADRLGAYRTFRASLTVGDGLVTQGDVDAGLATLRTATPPTLGKGLSPATLDRVVAVVRGRPDPWTAEALAGSAGVSRVTARRYLEHLESAGLVRREQLYGSPGRPESTYRWLSAR